jgi:purine nucleoside phosphorylase
MARLGIISGTIFLQGTGIIDRPEEQHVETAFGHAHVLVTDRVAFIPRHGRDADHYIMPHRINHAANLSALQTLGVEEVIAVNSTGSLSKAMKPGMFVIPNDFIMLYPGPTIFQDKPIHLAPSLHEAVRQRLLEAGRDCGVPVIDGGAYWQTAGPRFETKAEIRFMSGSADLVGMTMASEAIVAKELHMAYASLCSVDNYAHGVVDEPLTMEEIIARARRNTETAISIVKRYLERRGS